MTEESDEDLGKKQQSEKENIGDRGVGDARRGVHNDR